MKSKATCGLWVLYLAFMLAYLLTFGNIELVYSKLLYLLPSGLFAAYCAVSILSGFTDTTHRAFVVLGVSALAATFILIGLYWAYPIKDWKLKLGGFVLVEFITAACVFKAGIKHGLFKHEKPFTMP